MVLTVPASFDEVARELTLRGRAHAGLPALRLLEEPQAAFYDWLFRHRDALAQALAEHAAGAGVRRRRRHHRPHPDARRAATAASRGSSASRSATT